MHKECLEGTVGDAPQYRLVNTLVLDLTKAVHVGLTDSIFFGQRRCVHLAIPTFLVCTIAHQRKNTFPFMCTARIFQNLQPATSPGVELLNLDCFVTASKIDAVAKVEASTVGPSAQVGIAPPFPELRRAAHLRGLFRFSVARPNRGTEAGNRWSGSHEARSGWREAARQVSTF